jgi:hypothetical protein
MVARLGVTLVDDSLTGPSGGAFPTWALQEYNSTAMNTIHDTYAYYVYSLYTATTLSVVGSGGSLSGLPMSDTRYQAGAATSRVDRFATEAETANISIVTVNYSRISQTIYSGGIPADTNNLRWPIYFDRDVGGNFLGLRSMNSTDFYDSFVAPALTRIQSSTPGDYFISTSTSVTGATLVSATPVFTDTRANTAAYTAGGIGEVQDQPTTINNYYLHKTTSTAVDEGDLPVYINAGDENIYQHTLASWAATLGPWLQYYMSQPGSTPSYNINGAGDTMGSAMINTILSPTGTGYTQRFVNADDYRTQEFPNGTPVVANTYELKKTTV